VACKVDREIRWWHTIFLVEVFRGLWITGCRFFVNLIGHVLGIFGVEFGRSRTVTVQYPEERIELPERSRTLHRLTRHPDGSSRCVACMCCESICPAYCIQIVAGEYPDRRIEKYPVKFDLDYSRCVYCGLCVEACPEDAIRMDTGFYEIAGYDRNAMRLSKESLLRGEGRFEREKVAQRQKEEKP